MVGGIFERGQSAGADFSGVLQTAQRRVGVELGDLLTQPVNIIGVQCYSAIMISRKTELLTDVPGKCIRRGSSRPYTAVHSTAVIDDGTDISLSGIVDELDFELRSMSPRKALPWAGDAGRRLPSRLRHPDHLLVRHSGLLIEVNLDHKSRCRLLRVGFGATHRERRPRRRTVLIGCRRFMIRYRRPPLVGSARLARP